MKTRTLAFQPHQPRGVVFIPLGPASREPQHITSDIQATGCSHIEAHCPDGNVFRAAADKLPDVLSLIRLHGMEAELAGFDEKGWEHLQHLPIRNLFHEIRADTAEEEADSRHQRRFLNPSDMSSRLHDGRAGELDANDYAHRINEIEAALAKADSPKTKSSIAHFANLAYRYSAEYPTSLIVPQVTVYTTDESYAGMGDEQTRIHVLSKPPCAEEEIESVTPSTAQSDHEQASPEQIMMGI